jgi:hypothetical protein
VKSVRLLVAGLALLGGTMAFAQNIAGNWKGKVDFQMGKLPDSVTADQKKMIETQMAQVRKASISLVINANKTFTMVSPGMQGGQQKAEGKWTQTGNTVTLTITKNNGKALTADQAKQGQLKLTVAAGGKRLDAQMPPAPMGKMSLTFTR